MATPLDIRARAMALRMLNKYGTAGVYTRPVPGIYDPETSQMLYGEKLVNGGFLYDLSSWSPTAGVSWVNSAARMSAPPTSGISQQIDGLDTTRDHTLTFTLANKTGLLAFLARMGNTLGAQQAITTGILVNNGEYTYTFKPTASTQFLQILQTGTSTGFADVQRVSFREPDRTYNVKVLITTPSQSDLRDGVLATEKTCLLAGSALNFYPALPDTLLVDEVTYQIRPVKPIYSGDQVSLWILGASK